MKELRYRLRTQTDRSYEKALMDLMCRGAQFRDIAISVYILIWYVHAYQSHQA